MKKRIVSAMLVIAMLLTLLPVQAFAAEQGGGEVTPFQDVSAGAWYAEAVQYVYENGLFAGTSNRTFSPDDSMTRAMYVTVIGRQVGADLTGYAGKAQFSDVDPDAWYAPYVAWAAELGITAGAGGGRFLPDALVTRQQMAVFTVRLYAVMGWELPPATITSKPKDLAQVADYAKDAVERLWACGMFAGDTAGNFLPEQVTTRAQAAVFLTRVDRHLTEAGLKEPAGKPEEPVPSRPGGGGGGGGTTTIYHEVQFSLVAGQNGDGITLPESRTYQNGTLITELPTPYQRNGIFLGWYYDEAGTQGVESGDTVTKNMTLYADFADGVAPLDERSTPSYATRRDVDTDFTFQVQADSQAAVEAALTLIRVTGGNEELNYTVSGAGPVYTVSAPLEPGQTYKASLDEKSGVLFYEDGPMPASVRTLNFLTEMDEVMNMRLADGLVYLPVGHVSDMTGTALDGLISLSVADGSGTTQAKTYTGTFTYKGNEKIAVGDTVVIYEGTRPDLRTLATDATDDAVAYVTITEIQGTSYAYTSADTADVLFTPEVLPVPADADSDGDPENNSITVPLSTFAYTDSLFAQAGLDETTAPDPGDFLAFYTGAAGARDAAAPVYGRVTDVVMEVAQAEDGSPQSVEQYIIAYEPVSEEIVLSSMDIYSTRTEDIQLTPEQRAQVEADLERQAVESGFVDEAASYLMALAEETNGFRELSETARVRLTATDADGNLVPLDTLAWEGSDWEWGEDDRKIEAHITKELDHFEDGKGLRAELKLSFSAEKDLGDGNKIGIELEAVFEQEILLSINVSGGAVWKWAWIIPYIYDFELNANIDVGTYTGIAVTAVASTSNDSEEEGVDWEALGVDVNRGEKLVDIGEKLVDLMNEENSFLGQVMGDEAEEEEEGEENPLVAKYAEMMESADESWIELIRKQLFHIEGGVDPLHILVFGFGADFVVSANLYITLGMTFEYGTAKRYNFHLLIFHNQATTETIDLEEAHYEFVFYVMGTIGVRAGVELEVGVGLLSLKLDSIGVTAEVGAYAQLWGYFYYWVAWSQSDGKEGFHSGALYVEVGIYLEVKFKAQLFSSDKLTYNPTLYENKWPLWSAGQAEDVYSFAYPQEEAPEYLWYTDKTLTLPDDAFTMTCLDLTSGESVDKVFDDTRFHITFTNPAFSYDTTSNTLTVTPGADSVQETGEMNLVWGGAPLAFTSLPISRTISLEWVNPEEGSFIKFESNGGSIINMIFKKEGVAITPPDRNPKKTGYVFAGWYEDNGTFQKPYTFPPTMPYYDTTVYAKWEPATDTKYTVRHYQQNLTDSGYTLIDSEGMTGTTDALTAAAAKTYTGFTALPVTQKSIAPDGSTVVEVYYDRIQYTATFSFGDRYQEGSEDTAPVTYTRKYGSTIYAPKLAAVGYLFRGYEGDTDPTKGFLLTEDVTFTAQWAPDPNTSYRVEHYLQRVGGSGYLLTADGGVAYHKGETDSPIPLETLKAAYTPPAGFTYQKATVDGAPAEEAVIGADGRTVVKLYYDRMGHTVTWDAKNGAPPQETLHLSGSVIYAPALPTRAGYTFDGWFYDADTWQQPFKPGEDAIGSSDITLTAKWLPGTGTAYTVERYTEDLDGQNYTLAQTDTGLTAGTEAEVTADTSVAIEGFTYDEDNENNILSGTVAGDGSLVLKVYYARNSYEVSWTGWDGAAFATTQVKYGAVVTAPDGVPTRTGYTFAGWDGLTDKTVMGTEPLAFTALWTARGDTAYKVEHYTEDLAGGGYTLNKTQDLAGATASTAQAAPAAIPGFTFDPDNGSNVTSGTITADGSLVLRLYYSRDSYTLTWMGYGGAVYQTETLKFEQGITPPAGSPTRTGYTFRDWGAVAEKMPASDTAYTAAWTANQYTVSFDAGAGTVSPATQTVTYDSPYGEMPIPARAEHVFVGWYTEADGGHLVTKDTIVRITAPQTLFARWEKGEEVSYTVNHYQQNVENDQYTLVGTEQLAGVINGTTNAAAKNYGAGFTAKSFAQETITGSGTAVDIYYDRNSFTLTWDANGGTAEGGTAGGSVKFGAAITAPSLIRTGYTGRWEDVAAAMPAADTTYNAIWTANQYTVSFDANGGAVKPGSRSVTFDQPYGALPTPNRAGYQFDGWFTAADGGSAVTAQTTVTTANDHTLYARWTKLTYTITYDLNGGDGAQSGTYTVDDTVILPADVTRTGYTFGGWYDNAGLTGTAITEIPAGSTGDKTFYAKWTGEAVTVTFNSNGGDMLPTKDVAFSGVYGDLPTPTWTGRVFEGWFTDPDNGTQVTAATQVTDPNPHTLYAHWRPAVYTITLTLNGGALDEGSGFTETSTGYWTGSYTFSAAADFSLPTPTGAGAFEGWYDNAGLTGTAITEIPAGSTGDKAYYAKWNNDCKITYHNMDGHDNHADNPDTYTPGGSFTGHTLLLPPEQEGWTFLGWYWDKDFTSPANVIPATQTGDVDLYAWWAEGKAHLITTQEELADIENHKDDIHFLMNDLTLESWTANFSLHGLFDGRGHTITYGSGCTRSLFGNLYAGAEVKNLKVEGALTPSYQCAGGIAEMVYGAITDCSANLTIRPTKATSSGYCGGLAGLLYSNGEIRFTGGMPEDWEDISVAIDAPDCGYVGGLAGGSMGGAGQIANSSGRTVTVTADLSGYYAAGGIIGNSNLTELSGFAVTVKQIKTAGGGRVQGAGGLVGYAGAAMTIAGCSVTNATADTITAPFVHVSKPEYNGKAGAFYGAAGGTVSDGGDNTLNGASADVSTGNPLAAASALRLPLPSEESEHSSLPEPALPPEGSSQPAEPDQEGEEPGSGLSAPEPES